MDAFKFFIEMGRMCANYKSCEGCPLLERKNVTGIDCNVIINMLSGEIQKRIGIVEKWSKEHPPKTMAQDFFEKFPNAPRSEKGIPAICPGKCGYCQDVCNWDTNCYDCWNRPLEE